MYTISCPGKPLKTTRVGGRCTYKLNDKGLSDGTRRIAIERAESSMNLIRPVEWDLERFEAVFYSHDVPWQFVGHEYVSRAEGA